MAAVASAPAGAAPPPPPPPEVFDVAKLLVDSDDAATRAHLAVHIAADVRVYLNGKLVADRKPAWAKYAATVKPRWGRVLAYSYGWETDGGASLMVVDEYDTVDRSNLPPTVIVDPRKATRTTLYEFGADRMIHIVRVLVGSGFWILPKH